MVSFYATKPQAEFRSPFQPGAPRAPPSGSGPEKPHLSSGPSAHESRLFSKDRLSGQSNNVSSSKNDQMLEKTDRIVTAIDDHFRDANESSGVQPSQCFTFDVGPSTRRKEGAYSREKTSEKHPQSQKQHPGTDAALSSLQALLASKPPPQSQAEPQRVRQEKPFQLSIEKTLRSIGEQVEKIGLILDADTCKDKYFCEQVAKLESCVRKLQDREDEIRTDAIKAQLDTLGTTLWNDTSRAKLLAGKHLDDQAQMTVAHLFYTAFSLVFLGNAAVPDEQNVSRIVNLCGKVAIDLVNADEGPLADHLIKITSTLEQSLDKMDKTNPTSREAICVYTLARCLSNAKSSTGLSLLMLESAIKKAKSLPSESWVLAQLFHIALRYALTKFKAFGAPRHDDSEVDLKLQDVRDACNVLSKIQEFINERSEADQVRLQSPRRSLLYLLARMQYCIGKEMNDANELLNAESTLRQARTLSEAHNHPKEMAEASLAILTIMEDRKASLETMWTSWQPAFEVLSYDEDSVATILGLLQRTMKREDIDHPTLDQYVFAVAGRIAYLLARANLSPTTLPTLFGKVGFFIMKTTTLANVKEVSSYLDNLQFPEDFRLSKDAATTWLLALSETFDALPPEKKVDGVRILELASKPIFAAQQEMALHLLKKGAYFALRANEVAIAERFLDLCELQDDFANQLLRIMLALKRGNEALVERVLNKIEETHGDLSKELLLWIVSETREERMAGLHTKCLELLLLQSQNSSQVNHDLDTIRLIRTLLYRFATTMTTKMTAQENEKENILRLASFAVTTMGRAVEEDEISDEKAEECNWLVAFLYSVIVDENKLLNVQQRAMLSKFVIQLSQNRENFALATPVQIYRIRLWTSLTLLTVRQHEAEAISSSQTAGTDDSSEVELRQKAWSIVLKCAMECMSMLRRLRDKDDGKQTFDDVSPILACTQIEAYLKLGRYENILKLCTDTTDPLSDAELEEVALLVYDDPGTPASLLLCLLDGIVERVLAMSQRYGGGYNAETIANWIQRALQRLYIQGHESDHQVYLVVSQVLKGKGLSLFFDDKLRPSPKWPLDHLESFRLTAWEMALALGREGKLSVGLDFCRISSQIMEHNLLLTEEIKKTERQKYERFCDAVKNSEAANSQQGRTD